VTSWPARSHPPELLPGEIHIWRARVGETPNHPDLLSPDERERAARLRRGRRLFTLARSSLRHLAGAYLETDPAGLAFSIGEHGKPCLPDTDLRFSVSHSGEIVLVAFAREDEIGVDVEMVREKTDLLAIARRFFTPEEADALTALPPDQRTRTFFETWCRKEAVLKATGRGVSEGLDRFPVNPAEPQEMVRSPDGATWTVSSLDVAPGYAAALAAARVRSRLLLSVSSARTRAR